MASNLATLSPTDAVGDINKYDFHTDTRDVFKARRGLDAAIVSQISEMKREPGWMRDFRLRALAIFESKLMPKWGGDIAIPFQDIYYYLKPTDKQGRTWDEVPARSGKPSNGWASRTPSASSCRASRRSSRAKSSTDH
jgi:Fe-S cluster assembly protein SufB